MEKLNEKKVDKKLVKDLKLYGGAVLLTGLLTGGIVAGTVLINEKNTDHSEEVCLMTEMFGVEHQINKIKEEKPWIIPVYNDEQTFHCEHKYMTGTEPITYITYIEQEVPVYDYDENGNMVIIKVENQLIPITAERETPIYETRDIETNVCADDSEIKLYDREMGTVKTLKLK